MSTYGIDKVRVAPSFVGGRHEHIELVHLTDGRIEPRWAVIQNIARGDRYYTAANPPAWVYVHHCPTCLARDYITTHPDRTTTNNLLSLPRF